MNVAELVAIDVHAHVEISADGHPSLSPELEAATGRYFKAADTQLAVPQLAAYYRERNMAAVVLTAAGRATASSRRRSAFTPSGRDRRSAPGIDTPAGIFPKLDPDQGTWIRSGLEFP